MITRQECIDTIKANAETIVQQFDVRSLRLLTWGLSPCELDASLKGLTYYMSELTYSDHYPVFMKVQM